jgi:hypothetical protein
VTEVAAGRAPEGGGVDAEEVEGREAGGAGEGGDRERFVVGGADALAGAKHAGEEVICDEGTRARHG